jgi:ATP-binding cassette, subfamily G (WHITE), member 1
MSESKNSTAEIKTENNNLNSFTHLPQWPPVNISFEDINFLVENGIDGTRPILRSLSGKFSSGQLIAIMGPSG